MIQDVKFVQNILDEWIYVQIRAQMQCMCFILKVSVREICIKLRLTVWCLIVYYREFHDHMRVFTQFHTAQEHEQFLQNLQKERELKMRISELARYRRNGLTRHEECAHFEQERVQHEEWKEKRSVSYVFVTYYVRNAFSLWGQTLVAWIQATLSSRGKTEQ